MNDGYANRANARQLVGALLAAIVLIALTIVIVTAKFGETPVAELEAGEAAEQRIEQAEERREAGEELREEAAEGR